CFLGWLTPLMYFVPLYPTKPMSFKHVVGVVELGRPVVFFRDGGFSVTVSFFKFYEGAVFLGEKWGETVIPLRFEGA
ncbi:bifunctional 2-acylglycerophosphoethanolamine acyltransferase/acyl-ACP synthetase, partial [Salmonella enterica subsp. enterica serovar Infantis]